MIISTRCGKFQFFRNILQKEKALYSIEITNPITENLVKIPDWSTYCGIF